ncbi:MAG: sulfotransferase domain-containing protein [Pseudomonadota bacterium]|nr:sulfotransferase domain-containing protein [Pseudomonadota bacterium]
MVTGLFRNAGFFMGERLYQPRHSNLLGFFEDPEVNGINEAILRPMAPGRFYHGGVVYGADSPEQGQLWLARLPLDAEIEGDENIRLHIRRLIQRTPFCYKDPRFCYTLHLWRREVSNVRYLCVFRDPREVVASILKEVQNALYLFNFAISVEQAFAVWRLMYQHVLDRHANEGDWLFLYYDDLFCPETLDKVETFAGIPIDRSFPNPTLKRSVAGLSIDSDTAAIFDELMARAAR